MLFSEVIGQTEIVKRDLKGIEREVELNGHK